MKSPLLLPITLAAVFTTGCASHGNSLANNESQPDKSPQNAVKFQQDREAILAMAGNYVVTFDFKETVPVAAGYELKDPKLSGGHEVVRVVEDRGDFISLQHLLVAGSGDSAFVIKHWRQDWQFEPERMLSFIGGNAWSWEPVGVEESDGAWSQTVYQVEDAPRYTGVAQWNFSNGSAAWEADREWRPLPRRDMTTRSDYHAVDAVNRHVITDWGWVHEQDNAKLSLAGDPQILVHEVGVNTYRRSDEFTFAAADEYWSATDDFWAGVRAHWASVADNSQEFAISIKGETEDLYRPVLELARKVQSGEISAEAAIVEARATIDSFVTQDVGALATRLRAPEAEQDKATLSDD